MAIVKPFRGLRFDPGRVELERVLAPPYDVLSRADRDRLARSDEHQIVHADLPEPLGDPSSYANAAALLRRWVDEGVLRVDPEPSYYLYRTTWEEDGRTAERIGVLGALSIGPDQAGAVLPHERTTPKDVADRLALRQATGTDLSPIWVLVPNPTFAAGLAAVRRRAHLDETPMWRVDQARHQLLRLPSDAGADLERSVLAGAVLVADGHHRLEVARRHALEHPHLDGADLALALFTPLDVTTQPKAIHRVLDGVPAGALTEGLQAIGASLEPLLGAPESLLEAGWLDRAEGPVVISGNDRFVAHLPDSTSGRSDAEVVEAALQDLLRTHPGALVRFEHDLAEAAKADLALLLRPVPLERLRAVVDTGAVLPPKSTFFWPKPPTGLVLRPFARPMVDSEA